VAGDVYVLQFHNCSTIYGWLIMLCPKMHNGGCRYHELLFGNSGQPAKSPSSMLKFPVNLITTFRAMVIWKFCKFALKRLFPPLKFTCLGILTPNIILRHRNPQKAHPWANTRRLMNTSWKFVHPFLLYATTRKKGREGKKRYTKSQVGYISPIIYKNCNHFI